MKAKTLIVLLVAFLVIFFTDIVFLATSIFTTQKEWYLSGAASMVLLLINLSYLATVSYCAIAVVVKTYSNLTPDEKIETDVFITKILKRIMRQAKKRQDNWGKLARTIG